jgi:hypothetical protein
MDKIKHISLIFFLISFLTLMLLDQLLGQQAANSQATVPTQVRFCNRTSQTIDAAIEVSPDSVQSRTLNPGRCRHITWNNGYLGTLYFFVNGNQITRNVESGKYCYVYNKAGFRSVKCPPNF